MAVVSTDVLFAPEKRRPGAPFFRGNSQQRRAQRRNLSRRAAAALSQLERLEARHPGILRMLATVQ